MLSTSFCAKLDAAYFADKLVGGKGGICRSSGSSAVWIAGSEPSKGPGQPLHKISKQDVLETAFSDAKRGQSGDISTHPWAVGYLNFD